MAVADKAQNWVFHSDIESVWNALLQGASTIKGFKSGTVDSAPYTMQAKTGMSWKSWGEKITITLFSQPDNTTLLSITSSSVVPTTLVDYGKNNANIQAIVDCVNQQLQQSKQ